MAANGAVFVQVSASSATPRRPSAPAVTVHGLAHTPGAGIWVRDQATGAIPTTLRAKAWADGSVEPTAWNVRPRRTPRPRCRPPARIGLRTLRRQRRRPTRRSRSRSTSSAPPCRCRTTAVAPAAPQNLVATPGSNRVTLTWTPNSEPDIVGYHVYRSTTTPVPTTGTPLSGTGARHGRRLRRHDGRQRHDLPLRRRRRGRLGAPASPASADRRRRRRRRTPAAALQLERLEPVRDVRRGAGAERARASRSSCGSGAPARASGTSAPARAASPARSRSSRRAAPRPRRRPTST